MKKNLVLIAVSLVAVQAQAHVFTCRETADSIKNSGGYAKKVTLQTKSSEEIELDIIDTKGNTKVVAQLDSKFKSATDARYIDSGNVDGSDSGETGIFVSKTLLKGKSGLVKLTSNQANDGDSGPQYLWATDAVFTCEPLAEKN